MNEFKVIWSAKSLQDLDTAFDFLVDHSTDFAIETVSTIIGKVDQLKRFPESGPLESSLAHRKKKHRYLVSGHYKIIYRIEKQKILIVRIFDTRQNPSKLK